MDSQYLSGAGTKGRRPRPALVLGVNKQRVYFACLKIHHPKASYNAVYCCDVASGFNLGNELLRHTAVGPGFRRIRRVVRCTLRVNCGITNEQSGLSVGTCSFANSDCIHLDAAFRYLYLSSTPYNLKLSAEVANRVNPSDRKPSFSKSLIEGQFVLFAMPSSFSNPNALACSTTAEAASKA